MSPIRPRSAGAVLRALPRAALATALAVALSSCFDDPAGSNFGTLTEMTATVQSPNGDEGSAVLEVASGTVVAVASPGGLVQVFGIPASPPRIVVLRAEPGPISIRLVAEDPSRPPTLRVVQVGAPDNTLRADLSGYSVQLVESGS